MSTEKNSNILILNLLNKYFHLKNIGTLLLVFVVIILIASCQKDNKNSNDKIGNAIEIVKAVDNQKGAKDTATNYCFYLPKNYNGTDKLPVLFFLDPHANGKVPLNNYAELANKYSYIIVASNSIKNGQAANYSFQLFQNLLSEIKTRFVFDEKRIIISGFSGGAKLALIFAQQIPDVFGVIACGGSLPLNSDYKPNYYYAGIVGNQDFNYLEVQKTHTHFERKGFDFTSAIFNGKHEWPPVESFEMAIIGFEIHAMKTQRTQKNDKWLEGIWEKMNDSILLFSKSNKTLQQYIYLKQTIHWFNGIKSSNELIKQIYQLENGKAFNIQVNKQQKLIQTEVTLRSEYIKAIDLHDLQWWKAEIERIKKSTQQNDNDIALVSHRLLNYLSMVSFMLVKSDLENSQLENAAKKLTIYEGVDPKNPDVYLMYAHYWMQMNDLVAMKQNFKKAQDLGFKDYSTYMNDAFWKELMNRPELQ